jgi:hypothetical protein
VGGGGILYITEADPCRLPALCCERAHPTGCHGGGCAAGSCSINYYVQYLLFVWRRYKMVLRRARSITRGIGKGGPWKSRLFWALKWLRAKRVPFGPSCTIQDCTPAVPPGLVWATHQHYSPTHVLGLSAVASSSQPLPSSCQIYKLIFPYWILIKPEP